MRAAAAEFHSGDAHLDAMFRNALLDAGKQASYEGDGTVYVKTGDIPAEWLRDSSAQVRPYLYFAKKDPAVAAFLNNQIPFLAIPRVVEHILGTIPNFEPTGLAAVLAVDADARRAATAALAKFKS